MNTFDLALIAAGIDSQMISMLTYVPDGLIAAITPLYKVAGNDPWTNNGPFLAADLTVNGLKGDGDGAGNGTKYLHTGCIPSAVYTSDNDGGLTIYTAENLADNVTASIGSTIVNFTSNSILKVAQAGTTYFECWDLLNPPGGVVSSASGGLAGFWSGNRIANNNLALYFANSGNAFAQVAFANSIQGNRPTCAMIAHAINDTNNPGQGVAAVNFDRTRISFAAIHHGMTSANTQALFNAVQAYLVQKGGGFV